MTNIRIDVDVDLDDVLYNITDKQLWSEFEKRSRRRLVYVDDAERSELTVMVDFAEEALAYLAAGRADDARLTLERALFPKWKSFEISAAQFLKSLPAA